MSLIKYKQKRNLKKSGEPKGKIKKTTKYGLFIELEEGIEGFLHIDDISWTKQTKNLSEGFKIGDTLEVVVLTIDKENRKIKLGFKQLTEKG